jgi:RNA polymerase sigma-70 factor (ECF subfamily)
MVPEPFFGAPTPEQDAITRSRLSVGLLYLLKKLEPEQRIVFVLREVFEHSYQSIGEIVGKSEAACRQLMVRARAALDRAKQAPPVSAAIASSIVTRFIDALARGDEKELLGIIAQDACVGLGWRRQSAFSPQARLCGRSHHAVLSGFAAQTAKCSTSVRLL